MTEVSDFGWQVSASAVRYAMRVSGINGFQVSGVKLLGSHS
jgi:hypothetical protein